MKARAQRAGLWKIYTPTTRIIPNLLRLLGFVPCTITGITMTDLIACEYSQTVCSAIRRRGREAISNDLLMTEGNPDWHIQGSCEDAIMSRRWGMIVIHIPCTAMAVAGNSTYGVGMPKHQERLDAIEWTLKVWDMAVAQADCVALENPASVIFPILRDTRSADVQYIQPWQFGHPEMKKTGFALWRLPRLRPTNNVYSDMMKLPRKERERIHFMSPGPDRAKERARFFSGFANAIADQWAGPDFSGQQSLF